MMYINKFSHKTAVLVLVLVCTLCMSGCENGKSETGKAKSEMTSKSEYSEKSSENSSVTETLSAKADRFR